MKNSNDNSSYYAARERAAQKLADAATDPAVRRIHLYMAQSYRERVQISAEEASSASAA